jgi:hypothetical protein
MLGEKKVLLDEKERDNREELMELFELWKLLDEVEAERITDAGQLTVLVGDISKALVDLGMSPISRIPQDPSRATDVLEAAGGVLERPREAYASDAGP